MRRLILIVLACIITMPASTPGTRVVVLPTVAVEAASQSFSDDFSTDPYVGGKWNTYNAAAPTWANSDEMDFADLVGHQIMIYTTPMGSLSPCACIDIDETTAPIKGIGIVVRGHDSGTGYEYVCGWWDDGANRELYVWEYANASYSSDIYATSGLSLTLTTGDRLCCKPSGTGSGSGTTFDMWYYSGGAGGGANCTSTCHVGDSGDGCLNNWNTTTGPSASAAADTDDNYYCGLGDQGSYHNVVDAWSCVDP